MRMYELDSSLRAEMLSAARQFVREPFPHEWTRREELASRPFFSNLNQRIFFIQRMPETASTALLAMYSRLKNPRGIRGNWVDSFLPSQLAQFLPECAALLREEPDENKRGAIIQKWLKNKGLTSLDRFCDYSPQAQRLFEAFLGISRGWRFWMRLAGGERIRAFLKMWLDAYGHNSIARTGKIVFCYEEGSILTVKTLEWGRPAAGLIELSTRYVNVSAKGQYPVENEIGLLDRTLARNIVEMRETSMGAYQMLMGSQMDGPFPAFIGNRWASQVSQDDLKTGVFGETCDVLGNLLPSSTLTSVGVAVSAEAFPEHLKHLYLDGTPESVAVAECISDEARRIGLGSFLRHEHPSSWEIENWRYLNAGSDEVPFMAPANLYAQILLARVFQEPRPYGDDSMRRVIAKVTAKPRDKYDKLPSQFEALSANAWGVMSFRGWRDLQRMTFCSHLRSRVTSLRGFYRYPKPSPPMLDEQFARIHSMNEDLYMAMCAVRVPEELAEYPMALGSLVAYHSAANLRQWEFAIWQRSSFSVNDEVRTEFLRVEHALRKEYPWWSELSRADITPHYVFARGKKSVVMPES